jgi:signal transduction histidine kinase
LSETVDRMLVLATRVERGDPVQMDLADCARRAVERWTARAAALDTQVRSTGSEAPAWADAADIDQLVDNLIDNALSYAARPIELETRRADDDVLLIVRDHGPGFSALELDRVTDRFYRGQGVSGAGSGLGLAIARDLVERWGGSLTVADAEQGGARIDVRLPAAARTPPAGPVSG